MENRKLYEVIVCVEDYYKFEFYAENEDEATDMAIQTVYGDEELSDCHMTEESGVRIESVRDVGGKPEPVVWYNLVIENEGSIGAYDTVDEALTAYFKSPKDYENYIIEIILTNKGKDTVIDKFYPEKIVYGDY